MRRILWLISLLSSLACQSPETDELAIVAPRKLALVASSFEELEAGVQLVTGGRPGELHALERGDDGLTFSGFVQADPGNYTAEAVFSGVLVGDSERLFLGRWVSGAFAIVRGSATQVEFDGPLDTIGRAGDGGDPDADGLGLLDEIIWGSDPTLADTDGDGLLDGADCSPANPTRAYVIVGTIEDCDGDSSLRIDLPWGAGDDCNDQDATVWPGAEDACGDDVDQDCNASTCPDDDRVGPEITGVSPAEGATVGCHAVVEATILDVSGVQSAEWVFLDPTDPSRDWDAPVVLVPQGADLYASNEIGARENFMGWLSSGRWDFEIRTSDMRGNLTTVASHWMLQLDAPSVTSLTPTGPEEPAPFDLTIQASASTSVVSISVFVAPVTDGQSPNGYNVWRNDEQLVWETAGGSGTFTVDPTAWPDGEYVIYPVVEDALRNFLRPPEEFELPDPFAPAGTIEPDYGCLYDAGVTIPVRQFLNYDPGSALPTGFEPATMRDHIDEAITWAAAQDPDAVLVEIRGYGPQSDGIIDLSQFGPGNFKKWEYTFFNFPDDRRVEVIWWAAEESCTANPISCVAQPEVVVTEDDGFGFAYEPIADVAGLLDSDAVVAAYNLAAGCQPLTGHEDDDIRYESDEPFTSDDIVRVSANGGPEWTATATNPITETSSCQ